MKYNAIALIILLASCNTNIIETEDWPQSESSLDRELEIGLEQYDTLFKPREINLKYPMGPEELWHKGEFCPCFEIRMLPVHLDNFVDQQ